VKVSTFDGVLSQIFRVNWIYERDRKARDEQGEKGGGRNSAIMLILVFDGHAVGPLRVRERLELEGGHDIVQKEGRGEGIGNFAPQDLRRKNG